MLTGAAARRSSGQLSAWLLMSVEPVGTSVLVQDCESANKAWSSVGTALTSRTVGQLGHRTLLLVWAGPSRLLSQFSTPAILACVRTRIRQQHVAAATHERGKERTGPDCSGGLWTLSLLSQVRQVRASTGWPHHQPTLSLSLSLPLSLSDGDFGVSDALRSEWVTRLRCMQGVAARWHFGFTFFS